MMSNMAVDIISSFMLYMLVVVLASATLSVVFGVLALREHDAGRMTNFTKWSGAWALVALVSGCLGIVAVVIMAILK